MLSHAVVLNLRLTAVLFQLLVDLGRARQVMGLVMVVNSRILNLHVKEDILMLAWVDIRLARAFSLVYHRFLLFF